MQTGITMSEQDFEQQSVPLVTRREPHELFGVMDAQSFLCSTFPVVEDNGTNLSGDSFMFGQICLDSGLRNGQQVVSRDEKLKKLSEDGFKHLGFNMFWSLMRCDLIPPVRWRTHTICFDAIIVKAPDGSLHTPTLIWSTKDRCLQWKLERVLHNIGVKEKLSAVVKY